MLGYINLESMLALFLGCITPTIAFSSVNTSFLTFRQISFSLLILSVLAVLLGFSVSILALPTVVVGVLTVGLFIVLSERLISELFHQKKSRSIFIFAILTFASVSSLLWGLAPIIVSLGIYLVFSLFDLFNNRKNNKMRIFTDGRIEDEKQGVTISEKKNIYFLFLESMHPKETLKEAYDSDDFGLEEYLLDKNFKVYKDIYSNSEWTAYSLYNLLSMKSDRKPDIVKSSSVLSILKENGYTLAAFDVSQYVFGDYAAYLDEDNFNISSYEKFMQVHFMPLISQSRLIRSILNIKDPFSTSPQFNKVYDKLKNFISAHADQPKFCIMRLGADHVITNPVNRKSDYTAWKNTYKILYRRAAEDIKTVVQHIQARDNDSMIVLLGDHGSHIYLDSYNNYGKKTHFAEVNNITLELYAKCRFATVAAIYWPKGIKPFEGVFSHANIFRKIFSAFGAKGKILEQEAENVSTCHFEKAAFCVVKNGTPLERWEPLDKKAVQLDEEKEHLENMAHQRFFVASSLAEERKYKEAIMFLTKAVPLPLGNEKNLSLLIKLLTKTGQASKAEPLAKNFRSLYPRGSFYHTYYTLLLIRSLSIQGKLSQAGSLLSTVDFKKHCKTLKDEYLEVVFHLYVMQRNYKALSKHYLYLAKIKGLRGPNALNYIRLLRHENKVEEIEKLCSETVNSFHSGQMTIAGLIALERQQWGQAEQYLMNQIKYGDKMPLDYMLLAGAFEMQGKKREAFDILLSAAEIFRSADMPLIELGIHAIRNRYPRKRFADICNKADNYISLLRKTIESTDFFDEQWYIDNYGNLLNGMKPLDHFLLFGTALALSPNALFDSGDYTIQRTDVARSGVSAVILCLSAPEFEWEEPSFGFFPINYINNFPNYQGHPIVHLLRSKRDEYAEKIA